MSFITSLFRKETNVEDQLQTAPVTGQEQERPAQQAPLETQPEAQQENTLRVFVRKEAIVAPDGSGTITAFKYTDSEGKETEVAADSELVAQLDAQIEVQPEQPVPPVEEPKPENAAELQAGERAEKPVEVEPSYALPEYQVLDANGNVVRSYNQGIHGEAARDNAEKFAAKVNGFVKEIVYGSAN